MLGIYSINSDFLFLARDRAYCIDRDYLASYEIYNYVREYICILHFAYQEGRSCFGHASNDNEERIS